MAAFKQTLRSSLLGLGVWGMACGDLPSDSGSNADSSEATAEPTTGSPPGGTSVASTATTSTAGPGTASSTGGVSSDAEDSGVLDEGCLFLCSPDEGVGFECDPVAQDCPADQKCVWFANEPGSNTRRNAALCIPVTGDGQPFEPCTLPNGIGPAITDDCGAESYCLEVYGTADHGYCAPFVPTDGTGCNAYPGTTAALENGSSFPAACLYYECNPLVPSSCPEAMQCTFYPAFLYGTNTCWLVPPEAARPLGAACDYGECGEGQLCVPAEWVPGCTDERCCTQWCDLDTPACTDPAAVCQFFPVWGDDGDPSYASLGACMVPGALD